MLTTKARHVLFFWSLLIFITGCKKKLECEANQHFANGACVCDAGWFGWYCEKANSICGSHAHGYENWCVCDSGWTGTDCNVPIGSFVGTYHVYGMASSWLGGTSYPPDTIDENMDVLIAGDSLIVRGYHLNYNNAISDTSVYYPFGWGGGSNYCFVTFHKIPDDSVFFTSRSGGLGGGTITTLRGKKL